MFWREHSYVEYSTTCIEYSTLRRKSAFLRRIIVCSREVTEVGFEKLPVQAKQKQSASVLYNLSLTLPVQRACLVR